MAEYEYVTTAEAQVWFDRAIPSHRDLIEVSDGNNLVRIGGIGGRSIVNIWVRSKADAERLADVLRDIACPLEAVNG